MTSPTAASHPDSTTAADARARPTAPSGEVAPLARAVLVHAGLVGLAADLLLRDGFTGLGFPTWLVVLAAAAVSLVSRAGRRLPRETGLWLALATVAGAAMAWRDSNSLQFLDFVTTIFALAMAAVTLGSPGAALLAARMRDTVWAGARVAGSVAFGAFPLALRDVALPTMARRELTGRLGPSLRAALITLPLLLVFGGLLRGADPLFASFIALPDIDVGVVASHVVVIGFFTWITAGWARSALLAGPSDARAPDHLPFSLGSLDVSAALGTLNVLFGLYVLTQLGLFFGGERFLRAQTGLTAAEYARQGVFQMVWVVVLIVPVLLGTRAALGAGRDLEHRHSALALPLIALLGAMILSAVLRMQLYVRYYGLTLERFYPLVFMGWLAIVLVWLALTVLRGRGRPFVAGAVVSGLAVLAGLNLVVPDVIVARVNVARAAGPESGRQALDLPHLASLGGEAVPLAVAAVLSSPPTAGTGAAAPPAAAATTATPARDDGRCVAAGLLLRRWGPTARRVVRRDEDAGWRAWNRGQAMAEQAVAANAAALRAAAHESCVRAPRTSTGGASPGRG